MLRNFRTERCYSLSLRTNVFNHITPVPRQQWPAPPTQLLLLGDFVDHSS
jgi:hypothetical protein